MSEPPAAKRIKLELETKLNYRNGLFLAPMVRCGTLPTRLLSLDYGASLVWGPEIVDRAIIGAERVVDDRTGTISFVKNKRSVFESHPIEKSRLIYQIGSSDPELALKAAKLVEQDVSGIDLNCGCPKDFSLKGGMGAALLKEPEKLCSILRNLVANLGVPVSCKIRLLPEQDATLSLVRQIAGTGISNLTVHCRTQTMRDREPALLHRLREIVDLVTAEFGIPVVANGDCFGTKDRERICALTGVTSIMIARGAEANPSCFLQTSELLDPMTVILPRYVRVALAVGNPFHNSKYCLGAMDLSASTAAASHLPGVREKRKALKQELVRAKTYRDFAAALNLAETDEEHALLEQATLDEVLPALKGKLRVQDGEMEEQTEEELRHATRAEKEVCSGKEVVEDKENEAPGAEANASAKPSCASGGSVDASMSSSTSSPETAGYRPVRCSD